MNYSFVKYIFFISVCSTFVSCSTFKGLKNSKLSRNPSNLSSSDILVNNSNNIDQGNEHLKKPSNDQIILISKTRYFERYKSLNYSLNGNLATIFRSEWKSKDNFTIATYFLESLIKIFGDPALFRIDSNTNNAGLSYFKEVSRHISSNRNKITNMGDLEVQNSFAPIGCNDRIFTYYSKILTDSKGRKHQITIKRYIRKIIPSKMKKNVTVLGFKNNRIYQIKKISKNLFHLIMSSNIDDIRDSSLGIQRLTVDLEELKDILGDPLLMYSYPYSKKYILELKSLPHKRNKITDISKFNELYFVEKSSVDIDEYELKSILNSHLDTQLSLIKKFLLNDQKNSKKHKNVISDLIKYSLLNDRKTFFKERATQYQHFTFLIEIPDKKNGDKVKIEVSFDFNLGFHLISFETGEILTPIEIIQKETLHTSKNSINEISIKLRVPTLLVKKAERLDASPELIQVVNLFKNINISNNNINTMINNQTSKDR